MVEYDGIDATGFGMASILLGDMDAGLCGVSEQGSTSMASLHKILHLLRSYAEKKYIRSAYTLSLHMSSMENIIKPSSCITSCFKMASSQIDGFEM